jgi:endogenous inhibitor of DNA gyrase (YacG/DUF329 family)
MNESPTAKTCPICRKAVKAAAGNPTFPLCSPRCKAVDLGRWLTESYRIPAASVEPEDRRSPDVSSMDKDHDA